MLASARWRAAVLLEADVPLARVLLQARASSHTHIARKISQHRPHTPSEWSRVWVFLALCPRLCGERRWRACSYFLSQTRPPLPPDAMSSYVSPWIFQALEAQLTFDPSLSTRSTTPLVESYAGYRFGAAARARTSVSSAVSAPLPERPAVTIMRTLGDKDIIVSDTKWFIQAHLDDSVAETLHSRGWGRDAIGCVFHLSKYSFVALPRCDAAVPDVGVLVQAIDFVAAGAGIGLDEADSSNAVKHVCDAPEVASVWASMTATARANRVPWLDGYNVEDSKVQRVMQIGVSGLQSIQRPPILPLFRAEAQISAASVSAAHMLRFGPRSEPPQLPGQSPPAVKHTESLSNGVVPVEVDSPLAREAAAPSDCEVRQSTPARRKSPSEQGDNDEAVQAHATSPQSQAASTPERTAAQQHRSPSVPPCTGPLTADIFHDSDLGSEDGSESEAPAVQSPATPELQNGSPTASPDQQAPVAIQAPLTQAPSGWGSDSDAGEWDDLQPPKGGAVPSPGTKGARGDQSMADALARAFLAPSSGAEQLPPSASDQQGGQAGQGSAPVSASASLSTLSGGRVLHTSASSGTLTCSGGTGQGRPSTLTTSSGEDALGASSGQHATLPRGTGQAGGTGEGALPLSASSPVDATASFDATPIAPPLRRLVTVTGNTSTPQLDWGGSEGGHGLWGASQGSASDGGSAPTRGFSDSHTAGSGVEEEEEEEEEELVVVSMPVLEARGGKVPLFPPLRELWQAAQASGGHCVQKRARSRDRVQKRVDPDGFAVPPPKRPCPSVDHSQLVQASQNTEAIAGPCEEDLDTSHAQGQGGQWFSQDGSWSGPGGGEVFGEMLRSQLLSPESTLQGAEEAASQQLTPVSSTMPTSQACPGPRLESAQPSSWDEG